MTNAFSKFQHELPEAKLTPWEQRKDNFVKNNLDMVLDKLFIDERLKDGEYFWMGLTDDKMKIIEQKIVKVNTKSRADLILTRTTRKWEKKINDELFNLTRRGRDTNRHDRGQKYKKLKSKDNVRSKKFFDIVGFHITKEGNNYDYQVLLGVAGQRYYIRTKNNGGRQKFHNTYMLNIVSLFTPTPFGNNKDRTSNNMANVKALIDSGDCIF